MLGNLVLESCGGFFLLSIAALLALETSPFDCVYLLHRLLIAWGRSGFFLY